MLRILDKNKVPVKGLRKYSDLCIENSIELDDKTLTFSVPYRNVRSAIAVEGYIETKDDRFVVKEIEKSSEGTATITAQLDLESLEGKPFRAFKSEEQTIKATLQLAFAGTGWTVGECRILKKRTLSMANVSALDVLKQALKTYRVEIKIDSKKQSIDIYPEVGSNKGVYFSDQLNLRKLTVQYSTYDFYTEIEPYGKDGLTIETVNSGKTYLENHQYSSKKKRCIWKDERYTIADSLKEDAAAKLADMSKPYVSYSADIVDLSRNSQKYSILQYEIGDTVTLIDHVTGEKEKQRIVSMKIYPEAPEKNSCTLANKVLTFDELAQKYEDKVSKGSISSEINQTAQGVKISASKIDFNGLVTANKYFKINENGSMEAISGKIGGWTIGSNTLKSVDSKITLDAKNGKITTAQDNSGRVTTITPGNVSTGHIAAVVGHIGTSRSTVSYIKIVEEFSAGESKDHSSMCINGSFMADGKSIKIYNAKHVTSGGHLVFDSDGSTVAYLSSSAKRYKNHLSNMTLDEAEKILDIPVVWFNYKEGYLAEDDQMNGKPVPGMYAEDVAKYYPVGAYNNEEGLVENWNERMIIPAMLKLLQNLYKGIS